MNYRFLSLLIVPLVFFWQISEAQNNLATGIKRTMAFSLEQAQAYAYENNFDLKNSATDVELARKMVKQNTAIGLPQVNAGIDYMDYLKTPTTVIPNFIPDTTGRAPKTLEVSFGVSIILRPKLP